MSSREDTLAEYKIKALRMFQTADADRDLEWICRSFGFLETRDKKETACSIFRALVEAARRNKGLSSDELANRLALTRGTMVHHLNKMIKWSCNTPRRPLQAQKKKLEEHYRRDPTRREPHI